LKVTTLPEANEKGEETMGVLLDFHEKKRHKQIAFERRALQDLSYEKIERATRHYFKPLLTTISTNDGIAVEMCAEYALEAFLMGATMGKYGFRGEKRAHVFNRCGHEYGQLLEEFCDFWNFWSAGKLQQEAATICAAYLRDWWNEGFDTSIRRWKMKLY
jgi:hypothetical protein